MKKTVLLLGATGMLGSMLLDIFSKNTSIHLIATIRTSVLKKQLQKKYPSVTFVIFDVEKDVIAKLFKNIKRPEWIINAIGIIKPFIHDDNAEEVKRAILVNANFPYQLSEVSKKTRVIQIATDCVYSGEKGNYNETDAHDAFDVYGKTKSLGEVILPQFVHLRVSIIGPEKGTQKSLLEWFLHQEEHAQLAGFTNHKWNGITTLHFAKICQGIIAGNLQIRGVQHIIPANYMTKAKLLEVFAKSFDRKDVQVTKTKAKEKVDRTLSSNHDKINKQLWSSAGYKKPPTIEEMVEELAEDMKKDSETGSE